MGTLYLVTQCNISEDLHLQQQLYENRYLKYLFLDVKASSVEKGKL
jgi:hypothetical protein